MSHTIGIGPFLIGTKKACAIAFSWVIRLSQSDRKVQVVEAKNS